MAARPVDQALALAAQDRARDAVRLLTAAGDAGDVDALVQLAVWRLGGEHLPRDLAAGRALIRRAVAIGHVDGALMEVALTANGSGGSADWSAALALLRTAAANDPVAARHLELLSGMALDAEGQPLAVPTGQRLSVTPELTRYPRLLTPDECAHIAMAAQDLMEPSSVLDPATGRRIAHPTRTSDGAVIGPTREDLVIQALNRRIAAVSGTAWEQGEPLAVLRYAPGQQYRLHLDTIAGAANQRIKTVLVYLNEGYGGGETQFPTLGVTVRPRAGDAIVFANTLPDGRPDERARHAGLPVTQGAKWLATRWIRAAPISPWDMSQVQ
jgi:prolyl 4-hydroxylase